MSLLDNLLTALRKLVGRPAVPPPDLHEDPFVGVRAPVKKVPEAVVVQLPWPNPTKTELPGPLHY